MKETLIFDFKFKFQKNNNMKKITLLFASLMFLGGVTFAHGDKACCKKGDAKKEACAKEKKEACAKGEGCCSKDKKEASNENTSKSKKEKKATKLAEKA